MELEPKEGVTVFLTVPDKVLPHWADKHLNGVIELFAQLATKDGRRFGNGIVIEIEEGDYQNPTLYTILTDFGNKIKLTVEQIILAYHPPVFRMKKHLADYRTGAMEAYLLVERSVAF